jgi:Lon protease-like protein
MIRQLRLFPLNAVLFPGAVLNLHVFEPRYKKLIHECLESGEGFGVALIAEGAEAGDPSVVPHAVGSVAEIVDVQPLPFGRYFVSTIGRERFRIRKILSREPYLTVEAEVMEEDPGSCGDVHALLEDVRRLFGQYVDLLVELSGRKRELELPNDASGTSFAIGYLLHVAESAKQRILELDGAGARLRAERDFLKRLLPQLRTMLQRRRRERGGRTERHDPVRTQQEEYFGRYFSVN